MTKELRILVLEDNPSDAELMLRELRQEKIAFTAKRVWTESDFLTEVRNHTPDLILADYALPDYDGFSALEMATKEHPEVPFIIVSGRLGEEAAIDALHHGATDYVLKQRLARLGPAVLRALREMDLTDQRRQSADQTRKLLCAVEQSPVTIIITDTAGTIEYVNPKFTELTGYSREEAIGQNPRMLKSGELSREFYQNLWQTIQAGNEWRGVFTNRKKNGELFREQATISPVKDEAGRIIRFIAIKEDITERLNLEAQLRQSQKMDALGRLAGGVAHDFNNLLTIIQLETAALADNPSADPDTIAGIGQIATAAERATALTRQLLAFSRRQEKEEKTINLGELVTSLARLMQRILGEDIELATRIQSQPIALRADPGMIEQALLNLAVNARDAMPSGGRLQIGMEMAAIGNAYVCEHPGASAGFRAHISVSDTGTGIAPEHLGRIFEPFFTTKAAGKGTGLGLATVYGVVKQHHGWITVDSEVGRGTTFHLFLPALPRTEIEADAAPVAAPLPAGNETVLIAEDDTQVRHLMQVALERQGYHVISAASGPEALDALDRHSGTVHLLLSDLIMPAGLTGSQLAQQVLTKYPGIRVLFISGYPADVVSGQLKLGGIGHFLRKPFAVRALLEAVRRRLDEAPSPAPAAPPA